MTPLEFLGLHVYPWQRDVFERLSEILAAGETPKVVMHPRGGRMLVGAPTLSGDET